MRLPLFRLIHPYEGFASHHGDGGGDVELAGHSNIIRLVHTRQFPAAYGPGEELWKPRSGRLEEGG